MEHTLDDVISHRSSMTNNMGCWRAHRSGDRVSIGPERHQALLFEWEWKKAGADSDVLRFLPIPVHVPQAA